jgi:O-antigen/teichoic acid export membrane protein
MEQRLPCDEPATLERSAQLMSLKRQTFWSMLPLLSVTVVNIVSVPLFFRYLGEEMYALWFYVLTFTGAFGFMDLGFGVAVGRYIGVALGRGDNEAIREYWGTANAIAIPLLAVMATAFVVIGISFGPHWFGVVPENKGLLRWSFAAGGLSLFLSFYGQFWNILSQAHLDYKFLGVVRTSLALVQLTFALMLAYWTRNPMVLILWGSVTVGLQLMIYVVRARKRYGLGFNLASCSMARAREMSLFTGKTTLSLISGALFGSIDRLVLGKLAPAADFAHYNIAANVGNRIQGLSGAVMGPVFCNTNISLTRNSAVAQIYDQCFSLVFGWYLHVALWTAVWYPLLLRMWLGPEVGAAVGTVFPILLIGSCLNAIASISASQMGPLNRMGVLTVFQIATGLLTAGGIYVGWNVAGMVGVAWGYLFGRLGDVAQDLYVIRFIGAGGWRSLATWRMIAAQGGVALLFFAIYRAIPHETVVPLALAVLHGSLVAGHLALSHRKN